MAVITYEEAVIEAEGIEPGLLIWRRYKRPAPGITEIFHDINAHLRLHMAKSLFLPVGVVVLIPIDHDLLKGIPQTAETTRMWGTVGAER